jgi:DNA-binding LacI/PurR family transcriptional regulator
MRTSDNHPGGGREALRALLRLPEPPTAVVCATDVLAIGVLHEAYERGLRVPDDLSITGFDDIPLAAYATPALTTVRMPVAEMVASAVAMVIDDRDEAERVQGHRVLEPSLVVRESTAPPTEDSPGKVVARTGARAARTDHR